MPYQWKYGTALSGMPFPMVTASGTYAAGYDPVQMSAVLCKDGGAWASLSGRISGIPGNGIYTLVSLSSTEMQCNFWAIKVGAASGCMDQTILGYNFSSPTVILAPQYHTSARISIVDSATNVSSAVPVDQVISGIWNFTGSASGRWITGGVINSAPPASATVDISSIANQTWNTLITNNTSSTTFGGQLQGVVTVNNSAIASQVWNTVRATATSATTFGGYVLTSGQWANVSGLSNIMSAVSGLNTSSLISQCSSIIGAVSSPVKLLPIYHTSAAISFADSVTNVSNAADAATLVSSVWNYTGGTSSRWITGGVVNSAPGSATVDVSTIAYQVWATQMSGFIGDMNGWAGGNYLDTSTKTTFGGWLGAGKDNTAAPWTWLNYGIWNVLTQGNRNINNVLGLVSEVDYVNDVSNTIATKVWTMTLSGTADLTKMSGRWITGGVINSAPPATATVDVSTIANQVWNTLASTATSGTTFGGYVNVAATTSNIATVDQVTSGVWGWVTGSARWITGGVINSAPPASATVDISSIANQTWNTLLANNTSSTTFGGNAQAGTVNNSAIAAQVWNSLVATYNQSSTTYGGATIISGDIVGVSGLNNLATLVSVSGLPGIATSGVLAQVSGLGNLATLVSVSSQLGILANTSTLIGNTSSILANTSAIYLKVSGVATLTSVSGLPSIATSGTLCIVSGLNNIMAAVSGLNTSGIAQSGVLCIVSGLNNILTAASTMDYSGIAAQTWNSLTATYTSATTFGGTVGAGISVNTSSIAAQVWNSLTTTYTSSTTMAGQLETGNPTVNISAIAGQTWNSLLATYSSGTTFGGQVQAGANVNNSAVAAQVWNSLTATYTSATTFGGGVRASGIWANVSGFVNIATSGTLAIVSGLDRIQAAVSGLYTSGIAQSGVLCIVSGLNNLATLVSVSSQLGIIANTSTLIGNTSNILANTSAIYLNTSGLATLTSVSGIRGLATSGTLVIVSGLDRIQSAVSGLNTSTLIANASSIVQAISTITATVNYSAVADQTWKSLISTYTSTPTFGGTLQGIVSGVATIPTDDTIVRTSGTLVGDLQMNRWMNWENWTIEKTFTPNRLYVKTDTVNFSSYFNLSDSSDRTLKVRGQ